MNITEKLIDKMPMITLVMLILILESMLIGAIYFVSIDYYSGAKINAVLGSAMAILGLIALIPISINNSKRFALWAILKCLFCFVAIFCYSFIS